MLFSEFIDNLCRLYDIASSSLKSIKILTPSQWAEKYRVLKEGTTAKHGKWDNDYFAFQKPIMDAFIDKQYTGIVLMKSAQIGGSELAFNLIGWIFTYDPAPTLYLISTDDLAREFSMDRFSYMVESCEMLRSNFLLGKSNRETINVKKAVVGKFAIWGSQSPNKIMSEPYKYCFGDETDRLPIFPGIGSAIDMLEQRTRAMPGKKLVYWSHPTQDDIGIAHLFETQSTKEFFHVPCPKCGAMQKLLWTQVVIPDNKPSKAQYICINKNCAYPISDVERILAVRKGIYISDLFEEEKLERKFRGFHISQLYSPIVGLKELAMQYIKCQGEANLQVFYNMVLGLPYTSATVPITSEMLNNLLADINITRLPNDVMFVTAGTDVQGREVFYVDISAWTRNLKKITLLAIKVKGWSELSKILQDATFIKENGEKMNVTLNAIDSGYETKDVYYYCNNPQHFSIPVRYGTVPQGKFLRIDDVGFLDGVALPYKMNVYCLSRLHWMDRVIGRFIVSPTAEIGGVVLPRTVTNEYFEHIKANHKVEDESPDGKRTMVWKKDRGARDDFLQAAVYSEFAAWRIGLDTFSLDMAKKEQERNKAGIYIGDKKKWLKRNHRRFS